MSLLLISCSDNAITKVDKNNIPKNGIECLKLVVFPPNEEVQKSFENLYVFDENCKIKLQVSFKSGITCNSKHNLQTKAMGSFPSSYLKLEVSDESQKIYSYYIDLKEDVSPLSIGNAFERMKEEISLTGAD